MSNSPKPKLPVQIIFAILLVVATISLVVIAIVSRILPPNLKPTPTANQSPTSTLAILPKQLFTETSIVPTTIPNPTGTSTVIPTDTPISTFTPTYTSTARLLPDLIVAGISDPVCIKDPRVIPEKTYIKFSFVVRNIGLGSTQAFGPFNVLVHLILGQRRYSLAEWAKGFNGVVSSSNMTISNLNPKGDVKLNVAIDLKGSTRFGIEVIANSGLHIIPESDMTNNTLIQGYSMIC